MEGAARAASKRSDEGTMIAYQCLAFYGLAMKGRLKSLDEYLLNKPKRKIQQTPEEVLAQFKALASVGAPFDIKQMN